MTAWEKTQLGWLNPTVVTANGFYDIHDSETHAEAYILASASHGDNEYFLVENRWRGTSYDAIISGPNGVLDDQGIIIYHIDEAKAAAWWSSGTNNVNADEAHKAVDVECRDKKTSHEQNADDLDSGWNRGDDTDLWDLAVYGFCDYSSPCSTFWYDGSPSQMMVQQIPAPGPTMRTYLAVRPDVQPTITGITPTSGLVEQGTISFTISGTNFQDGATVVLFRNTTLGGSTITATNVQVHGTSGAQTITGTLDVSSVLIFGAYDVTVRNPSRLSATLAGGFTLGQDTPRLNRITPTEGRDLTASLPFTIAGYSFASGAQVEISQPAPGLPGGILTIPATGEQVQGTGMQQTITGTLDLTGSIVGTYNVTVRNPSGRSGTMQNGFTVTTNPWPTITSITPTEARDGGTRPVPITIAGNNFLDGATVVLRQTTQLGTFTITATGVQVHNVLGGQTITANLDLYAVALGTYDVTVTNPGGHSATLTNGFTITRRLAIGSIAPNTGGQGTTVAITNLAGTGFQDGATVKLQSYGLHDIAATNVAVVSGSKITCTFAIPLSTATGPWNVVVTNTNGESATLANGFTVTRPPLSVTSITPNTGGQGTTVAITNLAGTGFQDGATVKLEAYGYADIPGTNVVTVSPTQMTCAFAIPTTAAVGYWNVVVTNPNGDVVKLLNAFHVTRPVLSVSSIAPNAGAQGTTVAVTNLAGTGFQNGATVKLEAYGTADIVATNVVVTSPAQITCQFAIPATAALGYWNVVVTNPNGDVVKLLNAFHVTKPVLSVSAIMPGEGTQGTTVAVTNLAGGGFLNGATVKLRKTGSTDIVATNVAVTSPAKITCQLSLPGTASLGLWNVVVANPNGDVVTLANGFRVTRPPLSVTGITPNTGMQGSTVTVTNLAGTGFQPGSTVKLHHLAGEGSAGVNIPATSVSVVSLTKITCQFALPAMAETGAWNVVVTDPSGAFAILPDGFTITIPYERQIGEAVEAPSLPWTSTGDALWTVDGTVTHDGTDAARSGRIWDRGSSRLSTTVTGPAIVSFWWKVSSEAGSDLLSFSVDSGTPMVISGEIDWNRQSVTLAADTHTLTWTYQKDEDISEGNDAGWIDQVTITPPPTITAITPGSGAAGSTVAITNLAGTGFVSGATVRFTRTGSADIAASDVAVASSTKITCTVAVPSTAVPGAWNVVVTNPGGQSATLTGGFTVNAAPVPLTATSITPNSGTAGSTVAITNFAGTGFASGATVKLTRTGSADIAATSVVVASANKITCSFALPSTAATGAWNVTVTNPNGEAATLTNGFSVTAPVTTTLTPTPTPTVTQIPGSSGPPHDADGNGKYEDVNGNGRTDFADVVLYFNQMAWIAANEPVALFDYNGNGRIDFADVLWLFNNL